jgi:GTP-binding protein
MIVDEVKITVEAGKGGDGCISFRREKYVPKGGPDGGNGGRGGDIVLEARNDVSTLVDFIYKPIYKAHHGVHGKGKKQHGHHIEPMIVRVPVGTLVWEDGGELLADMNEEGMRFLVARGGRGGRGNATFTTSTNQAPRLAEKGEPGEAKNLRLELRLLADVGLVGFPNAGKSTLLSRCTKARPKIADYPFTTLEPQLGVVQLPGERSFVMADVPGLIEGASQGKGLGIKFLRHLERTRVLLHLVDLTGVTQFRELQKKIQTIQAELKSHSPKFLKIPQILVFTKLDALTDSDHVKWAEKLKERYLDVMTISAVTGKGLRELLEASWDALKKAAEKPPEPAPAAPKSLYQAKVRFTVEKREGVYYVEGAEIKKWVAMTRFEVRDSLERFHKILGKMGVLRELRKQGAKEGDTVFLEDRELIFDGDRKGNHDR